MTKCPKFLFDIRPELLRHDLEGMSAFDRILHAADVLKKLPAKCRWQRRRKQKLPPFGLNPAQVPEPVH